MNKTSGQFIVLEGPDGSGTTTQSLMLAERLSHSEGRDVLLTAEPSNGPIGSFVRQMLKHNQIPSAAAIQLAFCADRAWHLEKMIEPALAAGRTVICDRYIHSTLIYGQALGLDPTWLQEVNAHFRVPDIVLFALPGFDVCLKRIQKRSARDVFEKEDFQRKIYDLYEAVAEKEGVTVIDTSGPKDETAMQILNLILG